MMRARLIRDSYKFKTKLLVGLLVSFSLVAGFQIKDAVAASFCSTPLALTDMTQSQNYCGFKGGLYENVTNVAPTDHRTDGGTIANTIKPLDKNGNVDLANGKIVLMSVGLSNTTQEWCSQFAIPPCTSWSFTGQSLASSSVDKHSLVILNAALGGYDASYWYPSSTSTYSDWVKPYVLDHAGIDPKQVQVIWYKEANSLSSSTFPSLPASNADAYNYESQMAQTMRALKTNYPNLKMVFISSRIYAGYGAPNAISSEPYAYEGGFSTKWLIQAQIDQNRNAASSTALVGDMRYSTTTTPAAAPWIDWAPYLWANGTTTRSDGLFWEPCNYSSFDYIHPSPINNADYCPGGVSQYGEYKVATRLVNFFASSAYTKFWFKASATSSIKNVQLLRSGFGTGTVSSLPSGIDCGSTCYYNFNSASSTTITFTATTTDSMSFFDSWNGDASSTCTTNPQCTISLDSDKVVVSTFSVGIPLFATTTGSGTGLVKGFKITCGTVNGSPNTLCAAGYPATSSLSFTALPSNDSTFVSWNGATCNEGNSSSTCSFTIASSTSLSARFDLLPTYTLTATTTGTGTGSIKGGGPGGIECGNNNASNTACTASFVEHTSVTLTAYPGPGAIFDHWAGACANAGTSSVCTVVMNNNKSIGAVFTTSPTYALNATIAGSGTGSIKGGGPNGIQCGNNNASNTICSVNFPSGTVVTLTAYPSPGSSFGGWSGDVVPAQCSDATCTVTMDSNKNITATFNLTSNQYILTASTTGTATGVITGSGGSISCGEGKATSTCSHGFTASTTVTLTATASSTAYFAGWSGNCSGTSTSCDVFMNSDKSVTATFNSAPTVTISPVPTNGIVYGTGGISCGTGGSVCSVGFVPGSNVSLTANPSVHYQFDHWTGDCSGSGNGSVCLLNNLTTNKVVGVIFAAIPQYTLTISPNPAHGTITDAAGNINCGAGNNICSASEDASSSVSLTADPSNGYFFSNWTGSCSGSFTTCTVSMTSNKTVGGTFNIYPTVTLGLTGSGTGKIQGSGFNCGSNCSNTEAPGTVLTLTAAAIGNSSFTGWSGGCSGINTTCVYTVGTTTPENIYANFETNKNLTVHAVGPGTINVNPPNTFCANQCTYHYVPNTPVTLTASPSGGFSFVGWSGDCSGTNTICSFSMGADKDVTATFQ